MLVDSHCHLDILDLSPFGGSMDQFIRETVDAGIAHMLCVNISMEHREQVLSLAERYDCVSASVGVHPNQEVTELEPSADTLVELARHPKVIAIGETGLDYFRSSGDMQWQHERFIRHIEAARAVNKPLIIHTRNAKEDTLAMLKTHGAESCGAVMHCFAEDWATARAALDMGFYISFSGIVTFRNAEELKEVARQVPADRLLIETDSPYLAPVPKRGKPNYPAYVRHVAEHIADLRRVSFDEIAQQTRENFNTLFGTSVQ